VPTLVRLREGWTGIQDRLIAAIDANYRVYDGRSFRSERFAGWLTRCNISWPRLENGQLDLDDDAFREMAKSHPAVSPLRELRSALAGLRLNDLAVGRDGRNRAMLSAFRSRTGRNQPSNSKFIFGTSVWLRGLIKPPTLARSPVCETEDDRIPIVGIYRGIGLFDNQSHARIALVKAAIDRVPLMVDVVDLAGL
jgi:hypothetical protein